MDSNKNGNYKHLVLYIGSIAVFISATVVAALLFVSRMHVPVIIQAPPDASAPPAQPQEKPKGLIFNAGSFRDIFSGKGWIDKAETTMYQDLVANAFMFPPQFAWQKYDGNASGVPFAQPSEDGSDARCIGAVCIGKKDLNLYFGSLGNQTDEKSLFQEGNKIQLPSEVVGQNIVSLSVGKLSSIWVVGATVKIKDKSYVGYVFTFNGSKFKKVTGDRNNQSDYLISSEYQGPFGFGGIDSDWIAVYGAYQGEGYRVLNGLAAQDISGLLGIRIMRNAGFQPEIIRTKDSQDRINWYVFSNTKGVPSIVKVFQNKDRISGIVDYTNPLALGSDIQSAALVPISGSAHSFLVKVIDKLGGEQIWKFQDLGFDKSKDYTVHSVDVWGVESKGIYNIKISDLDLADGGGTTAFYLSTDGTNWKSAKFLEKVDFSDTNGPSVLWKVDSHPDGNQYSSVFLKSLLLEYVIRI